MSEHDAPAQAEATEAEVLRQQLVLARDWMRSLADDLDRWSQSARLAADDIDDVLVEQR